MQTPNPLIPSEPKHEQQLMQCQKRRTSSTYFLNKQFVPNAFVVRKYHQRAINLDQCLCLAITIHLFILNYYFELDLKADSRCKYWLVATSTCGVIILILLIVRFIIRNQFLQKTKNQSEHLLWLICTLFIAVIQPYPFLDDYTVTFNTPYNTTPSIQFKLNYLLTVFSYLRFIPLAAAIMTKSKYLTPRAYRLGKLNGTPPSILYVLQSFFKDKPISFIGIVFTVSIVLFSIAFRVAECQHISKDPFTAYANMIWLTSMTMTSVGFGEVSPVTPVGWVVAAICVTWGVLIMAVMVGVLTQVLSLNSKQTQSLYILRRLQSKTVLKEAAEVYLKTSLWRLWLNHKYRLSKKQPLNQRKQKQLFSRLRKKKDHMSKQDLQLNFYTEMSKEFVKASTQIEYLMNNNVSIINHVSQNIIFNPAHDICPNSSTSIFREESRKNMQ